MNKPEEIPEFIFDLMGTKAFDALSSNEKEDVLKYMTEEEYLENSLLIGNFQDIDAQFQFDGTPQIEKKEPSLKDSNKRFAFSYLKIAATVVILISLGIGFGQFFNQQPNVLPIAVEEDKLDVAVSQPVYVNVTPVNVQAAEVQLQKIEQVTEQVIEESGSSLEEDDYPEDFVIRI